MLSRGGLGPARYRPFVPLLAALATGAHPPPAPEASEAQLLAEAAVHHGVVGPLLTGVRSGRVAMPAAYVRALEAEHARALVHGSLLRAELPRLGAVIAEACDAPPILFKGPSVADRFYAEPAHRTFVDLDLLLPADRVNAAAAALTREVGYQPVDLEWPQSLARHGHAVGLERSAGAHGLLIELHWRVSDDPAASELDHARVVTAARPWPAASLLAAPALPEQLLLLALHLVSHADAKLIWLIDLALVTAAADDRQWQASLTLARELELEWVLCTALERSEQATGLRHPAPRPRPSRPGPWGPLRVATTFNGPVGYHVGHLATLSWRGRAEYLSVGFRRVARRWSIGRREPS